MRRRHFLTSAGLTLAAPLAMSSAAPSDTLNVGVIGCKGMGFSDLSSLLKVRGTRCVAMCDVDAAVLAERAATITERTGGRPALYEDYRALLDNPDVDAVIIGTPDHWHCLQMIDACDAGKHVYVEKPLANSVEECERMIKAQTRHAKVVQVGQWQRSAPHFQEAIDYVHSGALGSIRTVRAWAYMDWLKNIEPVPDSAAPPGVNYDLWLGPAPASPFNTHRFHFTFRWFWDYAGGLMTDWGVHLIDIVLWGMQAERPNRIMSSGGAFAYPVTAMETPDTQQAIYEFDDFTMIWEHAVGIGLGPFQRSHGIAFVGNNGTLVVDRNQWELFPEAERAATGPGSYKLTPQPVRKARTSERGLDQHTANFVDAIRNGTSLNCDTATASLAAVNAHLGNIALRTGETLNWDGERFPGNREANQLLTPTYRKPWSLPGG